MCSLGLHYCRLPSMEHFVGGKLNLKGAALDVKGGLKKKKKKKQQGLTLKQMEALKEAQEALRKDELKGDHKEAGTSQTEGADEPNPHVEDFRTPAEKRYHEQLEKLETTRSSKLAAKSHRQKIEEFNQYLANLSEHYDIPKVGPG